MHIRKIRPDDALAISKLLRELGLWEFLQHETSEATTQRVTQHIEQCLQDDSHTLFVAENEQGEVIGYTSVHWFPYLFLKGLEGYVSELFVAASEQGKGVGGQLLEVVKIEAKQHGCTRLALINLKIRESYQRGFYKKHGWIEREQDARFILELGE